ncbi:hypothetical protein ACFS07_17915 [Undibacterium arcticum]
MQRRRFAPPLMPSVEHPLFAKRDSQLRVKFGLSRMTQSGQKETFKGNVRISA